MRVFDMRQGIFLHSSEGEERREGVSSESCEREGRGSEDRPEEAGIQREGGSEGAEHRAEIGMRLVGES